MTTIMVTGGVEALDARDDRLAHAAVVELQLGDEIARSIVERFDASTGAQPDPDVGMRAIGLTRALWLAVAAGDLEPIAVGRGAWFVPTLQAQRRVRAQLMTVRADEAALIYRVGETWASRSTARKNWPTAVAEAGKRASSFA